MKLELAAEAWARALMLGLDVSLEPRPGGEADVYVRNRDGTIVTLEEWTAETCAAVISALLEPCQAIAKALAAAETPSLR